MRTKQKLLIILACFGCFVLSSPLSVFANTDPTRQLLYDQLIIAEMMHRSDFTKSALDKLERIAPNDPTFLFYKIIQLINLNKLQDAQILLNRLQAIAPNTQILQQAKRLFFLHSPPGKQALLQAKVLTLSGQYALAISAFDTLYQNTPPTMSLALDYWPLVAKDPNRQMFALKKLEDLYAKFQALGLMKAPTQETQNWQYRLISNISNLSTKVGEQALKQKQFIKSKCAFEKAAHFNPNNYDAWIGLGDYYLEQGKLSDSEKAYQNAFKIDNDSNLAVEGLISVYKRQSIKKAINYIEHLPAFTQKKVQSSKLLLESSQLQQQAELYQTTSQPNKAIETLHKAQHLTPKNVWLTYDLALNYKQVGKVQKGLDVLRDLKPTEEDAPAKQYALALYLSSVERLNQALDALHKIPKAKWDTKIAKMAQSLKSQSILKQAQIRYGNNQKQQAYQILAQHTKQLPLLLQLADWQLENKHFDRAVVYYNKILKMEPNNALASIGLMEAYIQLKQPQKTYELLENKPWRSYLSDLNNRRRLANIWLALNKQDSAYQLLAKGRAQAANTPSTIISSMYFKDLAALAANHGDFSAAKKDYKNAMRKSQITNKKLLNDEQYTKLTRRHDADDWLKQSLRRNAAALYQQQQHQWLLAHDIRQIKGTSGISDFHAENTMLHYSRPYKASRFKLRLDRVNLNAGTFASVNNSYTDDFGSCTNGCNSGFQQNQTGMGGMLQWQAPAWLVNIGMTPLGFATSNIVGDIGYRDRSSQISWSISAFREPFTNSLLAYAGARDPNSHIIWGGVNANGLELSLSYDQGKAHGLWSTLNFALIRGKNVVDNAQALFNAGYYYNFINENHRRLSLGVMNLLWHFDKNSNYYTLGHGGYFSPQFYESISLPLSYQFRNPTWSMELLAAGSWSHTITKDIAQFPLPNLVVDLSKTPNATFKGGQSSVWGYRLAAAIERRISSHFILGALLSIQRSPDFTPNRGMLYLKYTVEPWQGDLDLPPLPPTPFYNARL